MLILLRDTAAVVGDADQELFRLLCDGNPHRAARSVVLDGVLRQVEDQPIDQRVAAGHNAVKYNRPGGAVWVYVTQETEKVLIRVSDTGRGIPEEYQRSIFQPFFRVDKSRSREYGGAGLGLSLVWEIADLHGGSVWVEKSSEKGTTIAVELPTQQSTKP